ncbi:MAG: 5-keto-L-gluconate epimerase [Anaerolineales bacterium]|nr:5-keto-L-gluconate epimerase [Anaerolineales bacterium]
MRYGVCTWTFGDLPLPAVAETLAGLGSSMDSGRRFDGVELFGDLDLDPAEARETLAAHGLRVFSITPANVDICHPEPAVRDEGIAYYLDLLDFAVEVGAPLVCCHGEVGRIRAVSSYDEEWDLYVEAVHRITQKAAALDLRIAMEILNRYEAHLLVTAAEGRRFLQEVGQPNVGLLLDAYHMNIEEADLPAAVWQTGDQLFLFHVADSNREAVGRGHTNFVALMRALHGIGYDGDVIFECVPAGPDPFTPDKGHGSVEVLEQYLRESLGLVEHYAAVVSGVSVKNCES